MIGVGAILLYVIDWGGRRRTTDLKTASLSLSLMRAVRLCPLNKTPIRNWRTIYNLIRNVKKL